MSKRTKHVVDVQKAIKMMPPKMQSDILKLATELKQLKNERRIE